MDLSLQLDDLQTPRPTFPAGNLSLSLCFSPESALESQDQLLHKQKVTDDPPLQLGLPWRAQLRTTERAPSPRSGEASAGSMESHDEENGLSSLSRKKLRLSKEQSVYLEESFHEHQTLNQKQKVALAKQLGLSPRQVEVWFQNRRARTKLKQTKVDCTYLKQCCNTLSTENRLLEKELADLKAIKAAQPFNKLLPTSTLLVCPLCQRISPNVGGDGDHRMITSYAALLDKQGFFPYAGPFPHRPSTA